MTVCSPWLRAVEGDLGMVYLTSCAPRASRRSDCLKLAKEDATRLAIRHEAVTLLSESGAFASAGQRCLAQRFRSELCRAQEELPLGNCQQSQLVGPVMSQPGMIQEVRDASPQRASLASFPRRLAPHTAPTPLPAGERIVPI